MKQHRAGDGERILAVFIDFENLALGFHGKRDRFRIEKVLERLVEKGKIVAKKAYADWSRFGAFAGALHESAIELIEIPKRSMTGKNSADIRLVVDAVDLAYSKDHIDTFVIVSGDSDFSPLVSKLKELGKHVIGLGLVEATSNLLRDNCDEFIYYEDLDRPAPLQMGEMTALPEPKRKVFALLLDALLALRRENKEIIYSSMAKDTMKRKRPSFNEEYHGYRTFSELLEDAARCGIVEIEKHKTSGTYVITRFGGEVRQGALLPGVLPPGVLPHPQPMGLPARQLPPVLQEREPPRDYRPRPERPPPGLQDRSPAIVPPINRTLPPARPPLPPPVQPTRQPTPTRVAPRNEPPTRPLDDDEDDVQLGRSLIDDVAELDDESDELPSYGPQRRSPAAKSPVGKSAAKPAARTVQKPAVVKPAATKPAVKPIGRTKPAATPPAAVEPPGAKRVGRPPENRGPANPEQVPAPLPKAPPPAKSPPVQKPPAKRPPATEDDTFGAGLD
jgi:uncharacterized protein (TIGR00288 family)